MERIYDIGSRREVFWDDYLIDDRYTSVFRRMHHPVRREMIAQFDMPWEGDQCYIFCILKDDNCYRLYYNARKTSEADGQRFCYAESPDGIHWEKPVLGICRFNDSLENNILWDISKDDWHSSEAQIDGIFVFKDSNPACPSEERYKAVYGAWMKGKKNTLKCLVSEDGIHFRFGWYLGSEQHFFDSQNTVYYDEEQDKYICYCRGWHSSDGLPENDGIHAAKDRTRDIRRMESRDFKHWSKIEFVDWGSEAPDFQMYFNNMQRYPRAPHILVGFPVRYVERHEWTDNYDQLCGREARLHRIPINKRFGLAVTDTLFAFSRDTVHFERANEAFIRPEPGSNWSWVYGDCYMAAGSLDIDVPSDFPGADSEISFFVTHRRWITENEGTRIYRHTLRKDGFIGRYAGYKPETLVTKPFLFEGDTLRINFETSAAGWMKVELLDKIGHPIEGYTSCEMFGNSIDRKVSFKQNLVLQEGKPVRLRITMSDAEVYSFQFTKEGKQAEL